MNKSPLLTAALLGGILLAGSAMAAGNGPAARDRDSELTGTEVANLEFMREEEKLARDVYLTLDGYWGTYSKVFANIAESEQAHTSSVDYLLDRYDIDDPVVHDEIGLFTDPELQELYDTLVEKGTQSFVAGLYVGALIEEVDMEDIARAISETDERPIILVYSNLLDGSENHLRAFVEVIEAQGLVYEAQVLDSDEVEYILNADSDSGN